MRLVVGSFALRLKACRRQDAPQAKAVLKSRLAGRSSNEVLTKSSCFTLREGAMPQKIANTFCKKLHRLGEWVELFLFKGAEQ